MVIFIMDTGSYPKTAFVGNLPTYHLAVAHAHLEDDLPKIRTAGHSGTDKSDSGVRDGQRTMIDVGTVGIGYTRFLKAKTGDELRAA